MIFHGLSRSLVLNGLRKVVFAPSLLTTGPQYSLSAAAPGRSLSLFLLSHHGHQPLALNRLCGKSEIILQGIASCRPHGAKIYCQVHAFYRNTRRKLLDSIQKTFQKSHKANRKTCWKIWQKNVALGSVFLTPSMILPPLKEKPVLSIEPVVKKKRLGKMGRLLLSVYEFLRVCLRAVRLFITFTPILLLYPITYLGMAATDAWWGLLLRAIEFSGPILIKLGQWAATRRDIFPDSCCSQFSRLQRRVQPHSWQFTVYQMRKAFGPNWRKVFIKFDNDRNPIGSGCVAQVYKVWMSSEAIPDDELVEEILSDMDEDSPNIFEGLEVLGFGQLFGPNNKTDMDDSLAVKEWQQLREHKRNQEKEKQQLVEQPQNTKEPHEASEVDSVVLSVIENLSSDILPSEEPQMAASPWGPEEMVEEETTDVLSHPLVEEWHAAELDKSLPVCDAPPEDLEGLVPVAVKVLHPGMCTAFRRDLRILRACADFLTVVAPPLKWLSLPQCVEEFAHVMWAQINLKTEAENLDAFSENFSDVPFIKFPRPLWPYVTSKVLVETYEEGEAMVDLLRASGDQAPEELKKRLAQIGIDALLKMVFVDNLVHGDLHPGNLLVQNNSVGQAGEESSSGDTVRVMMVDIGCDTFVMDVQPDPNPLRICFLDCGVVSRLSQDNLANIRAVFQQVVLGDGKSVAELFLKNSEHQCSDPEAFKTDINDLVQTARESTVSLGQVDVGVLLQQVLCVLLKHKVRLESAFSAVVLAIFVLEGLGRALDPDMDILERARSILVTNL